MITLIDGPAKGLEFEPKGFRAEVPIMDAQWTKEELLWQFQYGAAYAICLAWDEKWTGPPQPRIPRAIYEYDLDEIGTGIISAHFMRLER